MKPTRIAVALLAAPLLAQAAPTAVDLNSYRLAGIYALPTLAADEASAVTYNWDSDTLFVIGDEGDALVEVSKTGVQLSVMNLTGFDGDDTEGLTYLGNSEFVIAEERTQDVYRVSYVPDTTVDFTAGLQADLGPTVGNVGVEGVSYDPRTGQFIYVKEKTPQAVNLAEISFGPPGTLASVSSLFDPESGLSNLGVSDLSDVQVLATVPTLLGTADEDNLLIFSQESRLLMEVTRSGELLSSFDFGEISANAEGVTIDADGTIFVVDEGPRLYALTPIPVPAAAWLFLSALGGLAWLRRLRGSP
jgi:uncharacterized protein YjiK